MSVPRESVALADVEPISSPETPPNEQDRLDAENRILHIKLDEANFQLYCSRITSQVESLRSQALQRGLESLREAYSKLTTGYKSMIEEYNHEKSRLKNDNRVAGELIDSQKQLIDLYQSHAQQQLPSQFTQSMPPPSQYAENNNSYQFQHYQQSRNQQFIDQNDLRNINELDFVPQQKLDNQIPNMSIQSLLQAASVEKDDPLGANPKVDEIKREMEEAAKPSKKRKTK